MIVSHRHRFIFLKTRKTAGTSVEIALSRFCGPDDIVTPIDPSDEEIRLATGGVGAQNYDFPLWRYGAPEWGRLLVRRYRTRASNHMPADAVRRLVGRRVWNDYYKFTVVRNPWDAAISSYFWKYQDGHEPSFAEFLRSVKVRALLQNYRIYSIRGVVVADRVVRYEDLDAGLEAARLDIGLPATLELPRVKTSSRQDTRSYRDFLSAGDADAVRRQFATEIGLLGYEY